MVDAARIEGEILRVHPQGYAFAGVVGESDLFLHCSDFSGAEWCDQLVGLRISFTVQHTDSGKRRAIDARPIDA